MRKGRHDEATFDQARPRCRAIREFGRRTRRAVPGSGSLAGVGQGRTGSASGGITFLGDPAFDSQRLLFIAVFNPTPPITVRCDTEADVCIAPAIARFSPTPIEVRAGGHCTAGLSGGTGMRIDVKRLDATVIDSGVLTAQVGTNCSFGKLDRPVAFHELLLPTEDCGDTCIADFMQGGGLSRISSGIATNCGNVPSIRIALADGARVVADSSRNADLFWAMRVGTDSDFRFLLEVAYWLRPLGSVTGLSVAWNICSTEGSGQAVAALMMLRSDSKTSSIHTFRLRLQALVVWQTVNNSAQFPFSKLVPFFTAQALWIGADFWTDLLTYATSRPPNTLSYLYLEFYGVAIADCPTGGNAFIHRSACHNAVLGDFRSRRRPPPRWT